MIAVYSGTFDPPTLGHLDMIRRAAAIFPELVVAIGINPAKQPMFSDDERMAFLEEATADIANVRCMTFSGLLVDFCRSCGARVIVRGLRSSADFDYEFPMALANHALAPDIETFFLPTSTDKIFLSSSAIREIASHGRDVSPFVPACVARAMEKVHV